MEARQDEVVGYLQSRWEGSSRPEMLGGVEVASGLGPREAGQKLGRP